MPSTGHRVQVSVARPAVHLVCRWRPPPEVGGLGGWGGPPGHGCLVPCGVNRLSGGGAACGLAGALACGWPAAVPAPPAPLASAAALAFSAATISITACASQRSAS